MPGRINCISSAKADALDAKGFRFLFFSARAYANTGKSPVPMNDVRCFGLRGDHRIF
jgi:hypothetical protein